MKKLTHISLAIEGSISFEQVARYLRELKSKLVPLEDQSKKLGSEIDLGTLSIQVFEDHIKDAFVLTENWPSMSYEEKRRVIENITKVILVGKSEVSIEFSIRSGNPRTDEGFSSVISATTPRLFYHHNSLKSAKKNYPLAPKTIGDHLRKKRIDCGLTQAELRKILKVTSDCITFWENNRSEPQIKHYPRISEFLGYHPIIFDDTNFRERLRKYRYENGASFRQMGLLLKVDASTVRAWEMGHNKPPQEKIKELDALVAKENG